MLYGFAKSVKIKLSRDITHSIKTASSINVPLTNLVDINTYFIYLDYRYYLTGHMGM